MTRRFNEPLALKRVCATLAIVLSGVTAMAAINPEFQPDDLYNEHISVFVCEIVGTDASTGTLSVRVTKVCKGTYEVGQTINIAAEGQMVDRIKGDFEEGALAVGGRLVAFAGKPRPRSRRDNFTFYSKAGYGRGKMKDVSSWTWTDDEFRQGESKMTIYAVWDGSVDELVKLAGGIADGKAFFPRKAYCRFKPDMPLLRLPNAKAVAIYDINGDGRMDLYACSDAGNKAIFQVEPEGDRPLGFADATDFIGLNGVASPSCAFADVNADGTADLLAGGVIYLADDFMEDRFSISDLLPAEAEKDLKTSSFVEINGDGYPDVVISQEDGGLRVYVNPGRDEGPFVDRTEAMGFASEECGAGLTGFFAPGDWNDDGRCDLFYAAGRGSFLVQNAEGSFEPIEHELRFSFLSGEDELPGLTGAGVLAPITSKERLDLIIPYSIGWQLVTNRAGRPVDITEHGGEITEGSFNHLATAVADLNVDGTLDYYTTSNQIRGHNRLILNRGYGMFMHAEPHKYYETLFQGPAHKSGGWGVVAGDVDNDGADDLLLTSAEGVLTLVLNDTWRLRQQPVEHPTTDLKALSQVRVIQVNVGGEIGIVGAKVTVMNESGTVIGRQDVGANVNVGCWGPNRLNFAVRGPGKYKVAVRFSDGKEQTWDADVTKEAQVSVEARREGVER